MTPVTDPEVLEQLGAQSSSMKPVTDKAVLAQLNDGTTHTSQSLGFEQSVGKLLGNAAELGGKYIPGADAIVRAISGGHGLAESADALRNPANPSGAEPGLLGKIAGDVPAMVGLAPLGAFGGSAALGALTSDKKTPLGIAGDAAVSGVLGKTTDAALGGLQKIISPALSPAVQKLMAAKIPLTPGQTLGGVAKDFEDKFTSLPVVGHMIKSAQADSVQGFNRAVLDNSLKPIGQQLPSNVPVGREGVDFVHKAIQDSYDSTLSNMTGVLDHQFASDINAIGTNAIGLGAKQDTLDRFNNVLKAQILDRVQSGTLTGDALKDAQQNLGKIAREKLSSGDADEQALGHLVTEAQSAFNDMLERSNPIQAQTLKDTNAAFAQYARIRRAASSVGSKDGVFTAPQYANAVKAMDKTAGKNAYARGKALNQDLSDAANQVLPSSVPDSGTTGRALATSLPLLLSGGSTVAPTMAIPAALGAALYTKPGQVAMRAALSGSRPAWAPQAASALSPLRLPLALISSTQAPSLAGSQN
jgi:hypothetical protein